MKLSCYQGTLAICLSLLASQPSLAETKLAIWDRVAQDFKKSSSLEDTLTNHAEGKLDTQFFEGKLHLGVEVDLFYNRSSSDTDVRTDIRPYESYLVFEYDKTVISTGYQIRRWGKTDEVSPLDIVTAEDFRDGFVRTRSERKISTPMIVLEHFFEESSLELLLRPISQVDRYDFSDSDWALLGNRRGATEPFVDIQSPGNGIDNAAVGIRYAWNTFDFDLSLDAYSGLSNAPTIMAQSISPNQAPQLFSASYERINLLGLEAARELGSYMLRADFMFTFNETLTTSSMTKGRGEYIRQVIALEKEYDNELFVSIQFGQMLRLSSDSYSDTLLRNTEGFFAFTRYPLIENEILLGGRSFVNLDDASTYLNPYLIFHDRGYWNIELGADIMLGDFALFNQRVADNDQGYLTLNFKL